MRRSYYDTPGQNTGASRIWHPSGAVMPFTGKAERRPAQLDMPKTPVSCKKRKAHRGAAGFVIFLLVIAAAAAVTIAIGHSMHVPNAPEESEHRDHLMADFNADLELQRAPNGDGTVLNISYEQGNPLTPQEVYEALSPSVVAIELMTPAGIYGGSGIVISEDGYIITNAHVVEDGFRADVWFADGTSMEAFLVGMDHQTDLAVLKVDASGLPAAQFGDSSALEVGDTAYAIGNPIRKELRNTMTDGIISALNRDITVSGWEMNLIQTTAAINPGNSGGALADECGRVIGITNMKIMSSEDTIEGLGFAIPTTLAKSIVDQLIQLGHCEGRPVLGVIVTNQYESDKQPPGARVLEVDEKSDAAQKGLNPDDVIISANGKAITSVDDLKSVEDGMKAGDPLELELWHLGQENRTVTVELMEQYQLDK